MKTKDDGRMDLEAGESNLKLAVGIATVGRAAVLLEVLQRLKSQSCSPDRVVVCAPHPSDVKKVDALYPDVQLIVGPHGLPHQRNAILDALHGFDIVVFFDDDFVPKSDYLAEVKAVMTEDERVVMTTGEVLADGILGPGLSFDEADRIIEAHTLSQAREQEVFNAYGCNMSLRLSPVHRHKIRFDEKLPLYAWLEDVDFSRQLAQYGRVIRTPRTCGVHLGTKSGRQAGVRLGYSQIANPVYLARKGTCTWKRGLRLMSRNIIANSLKSFRPEPWVDRRGRFAGNILALADLVRGRLDPERILGF